MMAAAAQDMSKLSIKEQKERMAALERLKDALFYMSKESANAKKKKKKTKTVPVITKDSMNPVRSTADKRFDPQQRQDQVKLIHGSQLDHFCLRSPEEKSMYYIPSRKELYHRSMYTYKHKDKPGDFKQWCSLEDIIEALTVQIQTDTESDLWDFNNFSQDVFNGVIPNLENDYYSHAKFYEVVSGDGIYKFATLKNLVQNPDYEGFSFAWPEGKPTKESKYFNDILEKCRREWKTSETQMVVHTREKDQEQEEHEDYKLDDYIKPFDAHRAKDMLCKAIRKIALQKQSKNRNKSIHPGINQAFYVVWGISLMETLEKSSETTPSGQKDRVYDNGGDGNNETENATDGDTKNKTPRRDTAAYYEYWFNKDFTSFNLRKLKPLMKQYIGPLNAASAVRMWLHTKCADLNIRGDMANICWSEELFNGSKRSVNRATQIRWVLYELDDIERQRQHICQQHPQSAVGDKRTVDRLTTKPAGHWLRFNTRDIPSFYDLAFVHHEIPVWQNHRDALWGTMKKNTDEVIQYFPKRRVKSKYKQMYFNKNTRLYEWNFRAEQDDIAKEAEDFDSCFDDEFKRLIKDDRLRVHMKHSSFKDDLFESLDDEHSVRYAWTQLCFSLMCLARKRPSFVTVGDRENFNEKSAFKLQTRNAVLANTPRVIVELWNDLRDPGDVIAPNLRNTRAAMRKELCDGLKDRVVCMARTLMLKEISRRNQHWSEEYKRRRWANPKCILLYGSRAIDMAFRSCKDESIRCVAGRHSDYDFMGINFGSDSELRWEIVDAWCIVELQLESHFKLQEISRDAVSIPEKTTNYIDNNTRYICKIFLYGDEICNCTYGGFHPSLISEKIELKNVEISPFTISEITKQFLQRHKDVNALQSKLQKEFNDYVINKVRPSHIGKEYIEIDEWRTHNNTIPEIEGKWAEPVFIVPPSVLLQSMMYQHVDVSGHIFALDKYRIGHREALRTSLSGYFDELHEKLVSFKTLEDTCANMCRSAKSTKTMDLRLLNKTGDMKTLMLYAISKMHEAKTNGLAQECIEAAYIVKFLKDKKQTSLLQSGPETDNGGREKQMVHSIIEQLVLNEVTERNRKCTSYINEIDGYFSMHMQEGDENKDQGNKGEHDDGRFAAADK